MSEPQSERGGTGEAQPVAANYADMDDPALLEALGDDAYKWAEAFCQIKAKMGWAPDDIDEGLMVGWFANAIENSTQVRQQRAEAAMRGATSVPEQPLPRS